MILQPPPDAKADGGDKKEERAVDLDSIVAESAKIAEILKRVKADSEDGDVKAVEIGLRQVEAIVAASGADLQIKPEPNQIRLVTYTYHEGKQVEDYVGLQAAAKRVKEKADSLGLEFDDDNYTLQHLACVALTGLMAKIQDSLDTRPAVNFNGHGHEMGQFGVLADGVKGILENVDLPIKEQVQTDLNQHTVEACIGRTNYFLKQAKEENGLGKTRGYIAKIQEDIAKANEIGKSLGRGLDLTEGNHRYLAVCLLNDLCSVTAEHVAEEGIADKISADYEALCECRGKADFDEKQKAALDEDISGIIEQVEEQLYKGVSKLAVRHAGNFHRAYKQYEKFYVQFLEVLGETEDDVQETKEGLMKSYNESKTIGG